MDTAAVFAAVDDLFEESVRLLAELVAVPSVAAAGSHLEEAAELVARLCRKAGFETVSKWATAGPPTVFADSAAPAGAPTLLFYGHYDVQPADPLEAWETPPFTPSIREGALYGRGAADNKGQFLAHIMALRALLRTDRCPVGIKLLIEGEEEIGSPNLAATVEQHRAELDCDLVLTADGPYHDDRRPVIIFGVRGLLFLELVVRGAGRDLHSGNRGGWAPTPAWTLVHALGRLRDLDGTVLIPGFHAAVKPPTQAERELLDRLPLDRASTLADLNIDELPHAAERSPWEALMFQPNVNIAGLTSGYSGPGAKTIVPHEAVAKLDIRLVPDQEPDAVEAAIRALLRDLPCAVRRLAAVPPSGTSADTPLANAVARGLEAATGQSPWRRPRLGGTTPDWVFTRLLGVPSLLVPYGPPDMNHHAPNERMELEALRRGIRASTAISLAIGERDAPAE